MEDYRGKILLLDIWSHSCSPLDFNTRELVQIHNSFGAKENFEILSIGKGENEDVIKEYVEANKMTWSHGYLDRSKNESLPEIYNGAGCHHIMLIDAEGKMITKNLRGHLIRGAVADAFGIDDPQSRMMRIQSSMPPDAIRRGQ